MPRNGKLTKTEKVEVLAEVAKLNRRGYSQTQIAEIIGVSQMMVSKYLKEIREQYKESMKPHMTEMVEQMLEQYAELAKEAWEAWEKSKQDLVTTTTETATGSAGRARAASARKKIIEMRRGSAGYVEFLKVIADIFQAQRELLGLDQPDKQQLAVHTINWDDLFRRGHVVDRLEARLEAQEAKEQERLENPPDPRPEWPTEPFKDPLERLYQLEAQEKEQAQKATNKVVDTAQDNNQSTATSNDNDTEHRNGQQDQ